MGGPDQGWYLKIRPRLDPQRSGDAAASVCADLRFTAGCHAEMERLQIQLRAPNTPPALADGGVLISGLMDAVPEADWDLCSPTRS